MAFLEGEIVIVNNKVSKALPSRVGMAAKIIENLIGSPNYNYRIEFQDGETARVKESEINKLTEIDKYYMSFVYAGNNAIYVPANEEVQIVTVDYLHCKAEVEFVSGGVTVVDFDKLTEIEFEEDDFIEPEKLDKMGKFAEIALEIGNFTDKKNKQYGSSVDATSKMIKVLLERYTYGENKYLIPQSLIDHLLLTVRVMDKQNRIFNNPSGEGDSESPWTDITGYGLIGVDMVSK